LLQHLSTVKALQVKQQLLDIIAMIEDVDVVTIQCVPTLRGTDTSNRSRSRGRGIENVLRRSVLRVVVGFLSRSAHKRGLTSRVYTGISAIIAVAEPNFVQSSGAKVTEV
jgi:hypothetical protein